MSQSILEGRFPEGWGEGSDECFFNLIKTPGGFEFCMHESGARKLPIHLEKEDKYIGTFRLPTSPRHAISLLELTTMTAKSKSDSIAWIEQTLANFRWKPESKGFA